MTEDYGGSMGEWAKDESLPIETNEAGESLRQRGKDRNRRKR